MADFEWREEKNLRKYWREEFGSQARWIEAASGGTFGLPDTLLDRGGSAVHWIELKRGVVKAGRLIYKVRVDQKQNARWMGERGQCLTFAVAEANGPRVWLLANRQEVWEGNVAVDGTGLPVSGLDIMLLDPKSGPRGALGAALKRMWDYRGATGLGGGRGEMALNSEVPSSN